MTEAKRKLINIDTDLILNDEDFTSDFLEETNKTKKKAIKSTKNIIKQILDDSDELEVDNVNKNSNTDAMKNLLEYEGNNILMIIDKEGKPWCRAKDITSILQYSNGRAALSKHVDNKYKKSFADIGVPNRDTTIKIDTQTIFINRIGMFHLISKSKMPRAQEFFEWVADEVIPELLQYGTYTMKSSNNELSKLMKNFYVENDLMDYAETHVVYLAYIGIHNGIYLLKFGVSGDYPQRELDQHRKTYKTYNVIKIWPANANHAIEKKIKKEMRAKKILVKEKIGDKNKTELIALNGVFTLDKCVKTIDKIVAKTKSAYELENEKIINDLKSENKKLLDRIAKET